MIRGFEVNAACSHAPSFVRFAIATNCNQSTTIVKQSPRHFHRSGDPPPSRSCIPPAVSGSMRFFSNVEAHQLLDLTLITGAQLSKRTRRASECYDNVAAVKISSHLKCANLTKTAVDVLVKRYRCVKNFTNFSAFLDYKKA